MKAEEFIKEYTRRCSNEFKAVEDSYGKKVISYHEWLTPDQALKAVEIARKEILDIVEDYLDRGNSIATEEFMKDLKQLINYNIHS